jgi:hypothetical protein
VRLLKNLLLVLAGTAVAIALLEIAVFPYLLAGMPTNVAQMTRPFARQLAQSSKAGTIPRNYIIVTGDSYAEGWGDGLRHAVPGTRQPYSSAHVIAERLRRDVITVGRAGWGTTNASLAPEEFVAQGRTSLFHPVDPPAAIFFYFYEGNDLFDNVRWARFRHRADLAARPYTPAEFAAFIARQRDDETSFLNQFPRVFQAILPATNFMISTFEAEVVGPVRQWFRTGPPPPSRYPTWPGVVNRATVDGKTMALADALESPALELSELEIANGLNVTRAALQGMLAANPGIPVTLVYLPSPLSSYELASETVSYQARTAASDINALAGAEAPVVRVGEYGRRMRKVVCSIARDLGIAFIDVSPAILAAGRGQLLHGPEDWKHFNFEGYRVVGTTVADFHASGAGRRPPESCASEVL